MKIINICKPDIIYNDALKEFYKRLFKIEGIKNIEVYNLSNWALNSLFLYEYDCFNLSKEAEQKKRKEIITTSKGYDILYHNKDAELLLLDIDKQYDTFDKLEKIKKDFRKKYVYQNKASYIKFINENEIDFLKKFNRETLINIRGIIKTYEKELKKCPELFYMIYFNMIHFPSSEEENNYELNLLKKNLVTKKMIRRLVF